jgi:hypothetical protein
MTKLNDVFIYDSFHNADSGLRADVFGVMDGYRVRLVDTDCGETVQTFKTFGGLYAATEYARKLVS